MMTPRDFFWTVRKRCDQFFWNVVLHIGLILGAIGAALISVADERIGRGDELMDEPGHRQRPGIGDHHGLGRFQMDGSRDAGRNVGGEQIGATKGDLRDVR